MDERQFDIQVEGITKAEYLQASREMILSMVPMGLVMVTLVTVCILLFLSEITWAAVIAPYVVLLVVVALGLLYLELDWKKFPKDMAFSYLIDAEGWQLTVGESYGGADWVETPKLKEKSKVLLFYQRDSTASSSLPKRCLTDEQLEAIRGWYQASRADFKQTEKRWRQEDQQARRARRGK